MRSVISFMVLAAALTAAPVSPEIPLGQQLTSGDLTAIVTTYGTCPTVPGVILPCVPVEIRPTGLMVSILDSGAAPASVIITAVIETADGLRKRYSVTAAWSPNQYGWSNTFMPTKGLPVRVVSMSIVTVLPGQEHTL